MPAGCGSCTMTTSPARTIGASSAALLVFTRSYSSCSAWPMGEPSPTLPWMALCSRFVMRKNSGGPWITAQRASTPAPRAYASNERTISATPPLTAVELTFQTTRPLRRALNEATRALTRPMRSALSNVE